MLEHLHVQNTNLGGFFYPPEKKTCGAEFGMGNVWTAAKANFRSHLIANKDFAVELY